MSDTAFLRKFEFKASFPWLTLALPDWKALLDSSQVKPDVPDSQFGNFRISKSISESIPYFQNNILLPSMKYLIKRCKLTDPIIIMYGLHLQNFLIWTPKRDWWFKEFSACTINWSKSYVHNYAHMYLILKLYINTFKLAWRVGNKPIHQ